MSRFAHVFGKCFIKGFFMILDHTIQSIQLELSPIHIAWFAFYNTSVWIQGSEAWWLTCCKVATHHTDIVFDCVEWCIVKFIRDIDFETYLSHDESRVKEREKRERERIKRCLWCVEKGLPEWTFAWRWGKVWIHQAHKRETRAWLRPIYPTLTTIVPNRLSHWFLSFSRKRFCLGKTKVLWETKSFTWSFFFLYNGWKQ